MTQDQTPPPSPTPPLPVYRTTTHQPLPEQLHYFDNRQMALGVNREDPGPYLQQMPIHTPGKVSCGGGRLHAPSPTRHSRA
jgi:hypothetical protein